MQKMNFLIKPIEGTEHWYDIHTNFDFTPELIDLLVETQGVVFVFDKITNRYTVTCELPELFTFEEVEKNISETTNAYIQPLKQEQEK